MRYCTRLVAYACLMLAVMPGVASACAIDNKASLFVNGVQATLNLSAPTGGPWASFTIGKAFASGAPVSFYENQAELVHSLPRATVAASYRWSFGDGATALGHWVSHRYARPGLYRLEVEGWSSKAHSWFPFDNALLHIVPPGQVLQANLGYYALRGLDVVMSALGWLIDAVLIGAVLLVIGHRLRARRAASRTAAAGDAGSAPRDVPAPHEQARSTGEKPVAR